MPRRFYSAYAKKKKSYGRRPFKKTYASSYASTNVKNVAPKEGGFKITRVVENITAISNSNAVNTPVAINPAGTTMLHIGSPEVTGLGTSLYNVPFAFTFHLDNIAGYGDITSIADQYCIYGISVVARYNSNSVSGDGGVGVQQCVPVMRWVPDYDDGAVESPASIRQKMGLRTTRLDKDVKIYIKPKTAGIVSADTTIPTGFIVNTKTTYCNSAYAQIQHFGIKGYIENMNITSTSNVLSFVNFEVKYYIRAKSLQ